MSYQIRFRKAAKVEFGTCSETYSCMQEGLIAWLSELAAEASGKDYEASVDMENLLESVLEAEDTPPSSWPYSWFIWKRAPLAKKIKALLAVVRKRRPPWELRASVRVFSVLGGVFSSTVTVFYEVDHTAKRIIVTKWDGLPGQ